MTGIMNRNGAGFTLRGTRVVRFGGAISAPFIYMIF
jgi:hypothetical protein